MKYSPSCFAMSLAQQSRIFFIITILSFFIPSHAEIKASENEVEKTKDDIRNIVIEALETEIRSAIVEQMTHSEKKDQPKKTSMPEESKPASKDLELVKQESQSELEQELKQEISSVVEEDKKQSTIADKKNIQDTDNTNKTSDNAQQEVTLNQTKKKKKMQNKKPKSTGWIYIGRFETGQWDDQILNVGNTLPKIKQQYKIQATSVNIRDALPKKDEFGELVLGKSLKTLVSRKKITILKLHRSGKSQHYWAKIAYNKR